MGRYLFDLEIDVKNAELIARLKEQCDRDAAEHCPAEIIALQAECIAAIEALEAEVERLTTLAHGQHIELYNARLQLAAAQGQEPVLQVVNGELCYKSTEDDQSFGMWCPVTPDYHPPFKNGSGFYAAPIPQQVATRVPEGWKLVPVEATPEMISAGAVHHYGACSRQDRSDADKAWDAMIAAAPQPKETK